MSATATAEARAGRPTGGIVSWLTTTDHKRIGVLYLVTTFAFFLVGGAFAGIIRAQLTFPEQSLVGTQNVVRNLDPSMGSEDFSFMLQAKPGAMARLGQGGAELGCFLHNSTYDFNDEVIPLGAGFLAAIAERAMPLGK